MSFTPRRLRDPPPARPPAGPPVPDLLRTRQPGSVRRPPAHAPVRAISARYTRHPGPTKACNEIRCCASLRSTIPTPRVQRVGFDLTDPYVEHCWSAVIGPTSTLLLRRLPALWIARVPIDIGASDLSRSLGLGPAPASTAVS